MSRLLDAFARVLHERRGSPLVFSLTGTSWSAADLDEWADALNVRLDAARIPPGTPVVTALGNRAEFIAVVLACLRSGRPVLPADPGTTAGGATDLARSFGAAAMVAAPSLLHRPTHGLPGGSELAVLDSVEPRAYHDAAILKLTSGSTGSPKAVVGSAENLAADVDQIVTAMDIGTDDVQLGTIPLSHSYGLGNLVLPVLWQGTRVGLREGFVPQRLHDDVSALAIRVWPGVPFMFEHLLAHGEPELPRSLGRLISAGAPLGAPLLCGFYERFGRKIHTFYGASETGGITYDDSDIVDGQRGVGRALPSARVTLRPVPGMDQEGGRVHVAGPAVARGYSPGHDDGAEFCEGGFLTGDLGRLEPDGRLILSGRISAFVNVAGRKVHPDEVMRHVREMPGIRDVRVVGAPSTSRGEQLVAIVVPESTAPTLLELRRFCSARLPAYKIPRAIVVADAIPLDVRGKTDRQRLEALVAAHLAREGPADRGES